MSYHKVLGDVSGGTFSSQNEIDRVFRLYEGKSVSVSIRERAPKRTDQQRKYQWGVLYEMIAEETGHTTLEIHEILQRKFLSYETNIGWLVKSTADLSIAQHSKYLEECKAWASYHLGLIIPDPE